MYNDELSRGKLPLLLYVVLRSYFLEATRFKHQRGDLYKGISLLTSSGVKTRTSTLEELQGTGTDDEAVFLLDMSYVQLKLRPGR